MNVDIIDAIGHVLSAVDRTRVAARVEHTLGSTVRRLQTWVDAPEGTWESLDADGEHQIFNPVDGLLIVSSDGAREELRDRHKLVARPLRPFFPLEMPIWARTRDAARIKNVSRGTDRIDFTLETVHGSLGQAVFSLDHECFIVYELEGEHYAVSELHPIGPRTEYWWG